MRKAEDGSGEVVAANHLMQLQDEETTAPAEEPSLLVWVGNWIRLGLIEVDYTWRLVAENHYAWVEGRPEFVRLAETDPRGRDSLNVLHGNVSATDFGARFLTAVSFDGVPVDGAPGSG